MRQYRKLAAEAIEANWATLAPWIAQSIFDSSVPAELAEIKAKLIEGKMQVWFATRDQSMQFILVTEGFRIDGLNTLVLRMAVGFDVDLLLPDFHLLENWARNAGFSQIQVWGREGWKRKLRPLGFRFGYTCLTKELDRKTH